MLHCSRVARGAVEAVTTRRHAPPPAALFAARRRPRLLYVYSSADAFPLAAPPAPTSHTGDVVRGEPARFAHMEPLDCRMPPQWEKVGYGSIFTAQKSEKL